MEVLVSTNVLVRRYWHSILHIVGLLIEVVWAFQDYGVLEPATHSLLMTVPLLETNMVCTILMAARCW